jgi:hypothetical protein
VRSGATVLTGVELLDVAVTRSWAGWYELAPDHITTNYLITGGWG